MDHQRTRSWRWPDVAFGIVMFILVAAVIFGISWWDSKQIPPPKLEPVDTRAEPPNFEIKPVEIDGMRCYVLYGDIEDFWCSNSIESPRPDSSGRDAEGGTVE